ncbi:hypothetical protein AAV35_000580 [Salimicrobium jeotgali]|uniref:Uncharacterized protein n=2 Tax=Salimicrobium TaxID=351195 RepID=K2FI57_9BACI|nr:MULTISPECIES: hypothetical protein [Salimicrobium]AKG03420.1 hypothetical protein AAV35_000580 [Salimicrobium jeotgali]EKE30746.1 hypothetical protein MJ3_12290 [Salimicrobium jeotgali]MBM7697125.1 hypothetical protein [Salimicrobium jeotgali]PBB06885.1 hypothetical protein CKW00_00035 [Salimicrobium humidisoli]
MNQSNIYDFLNVDQDPLYQSLQSLQTGDRYRLDDQTEIHCNVHGLYEVIAEETEQAFSSLEDCYSYISACGFEVKSDRL